MNAPGTAARGLRNSVVYVGAAGFQRGVSFLLLVFVTHVMDPAEYGRLALVLTISGAAALLFGLGLDLAIFRSFFALAGRPEEQRRYVGTMWTFLIGTPLAAAALLALVGLGFANGRLLRPGELALGLLGAAFFVGTTTVPLAVLRAEERLRPYLVVTMVTALGTGAAALTFVLVVDWGVAGWLAGVVTGNLLGLVAALRVVPWHPTVMDWDAVRRSVRFSLPLLPHAFSLWALQLLDRAILAGLVTASALGVYSLAGNFAQIAFITMLSLNQGLMPSYARAANDAVAEDDLGHTVLLHVAVIVCTCTALGLVLPPTIDLVISSEYGDASGLIGWLVLGYAFLGLYFIPMNAVSLIAGRTARVWVVSLSAAAANIALLYAVVPGGGLKGAAIASAGGYAVLLAGMLLYARDALAALRVDWVRVATVLGTGALVYGVAVAATASISAAGALVARTACLIVLGLAMAALVGVDMNALVRRLSMRAPAS